MQIQVYNGKEYKLYKGEKYFSRGCKRLHRVVWETETGQTIPKGYHVHHKDHNAQNNNFDNLELIKDKKHNKLHAYTRFTGKEPWFKDFHAKGIEAAKAWHKSPEGLAQHRKQAIEQGFGLLTYGDAPCQQCKTMFTRKKKHQYFCSNACKSKHRRGLKLDNVTRQCKVCGKEFEVNKYAKRLFCTVGCKG